MGGLWFLIYLICHIIIGQFLLKTFKTTKTRWVFKTTFILICIVIPVMYVKQFLAYTPYDMGGSLWERWLGIEGAKLKSKKHGMD